MHLIESVSKVNFHRKDAKTRKNNSIDFQLSAPYHLNGEEGKACVYDSLTGRYANNLIND
jgi:hypothetical protein